MSVDVRRLQVAILARSPREMYKTDRILPRYILSRVRVSNRPRFFLYANKIQTSHPLTDWAAHGSAPPTVRTAQQFEKQFIHSRQVATYVTIHTNGLGPSLGMQARYSFRHLAPSATLATYAGLHSQVICTCVSLKCIHITGNYR